MAADGTRPRSKAVRAAQTARGAPETGRGHGSLTAEYSASHTGAPRRKRRTQRWAALTFMAVKPAVVSQRKSASTPSEQLQKYKGYRRPEYARQAAGLTFLGRRIYAPCLKPSGGTESGGG